MAQRIIAEFSSPRDELLGVCPYVSDVSREWIFNDFGTASFSLPGTTPRLYEFVNWGNIVRLHEEGVPSWVGVVTERKWNKGNVQLNLKSAEWLLQKKITRQGLLLGANGGVAAGAIASALFYSAAIRSNRVQNLKPGNFDATTMHFRQYDYVDLFDALQEMAEKDGAAFWVDTDLFVHYRNRRGVDKSQGNYPIVLYEDTQLIDVELTERIENVITAAMALGAGDSLTAKPKYGVAINHPRLFRAEVMNQSGVKTPAGLVEPTKAIIKERSEPELLVDATMLRYDNKRDGTPQFAEWGKFWLGDIVKLVLYSTGYPLEVSAQLIGAGIDEENKMRLVSKLVNLPVPPYEYLAWTPT